MESWNTMYLVLSEMILRLFFVAFWLFLRFDKSDPLSTLRQFIQQHIWIVQFFITLTKLPVVEVIIHIEIGVLSLSKLLLQLSDSFHILYWNRITNIVLDVHVHFERIAFG